MALYESLGPQDLMTAIPYDHPSRPTSASATVSTTKRLATAARVASLAFLLVCWSVGAYAGITYWAVQGSLLGVIASAVIPGVAASSTLSIFTAMEGAVRGDTALSARRRPERHRWTRSSE